MKKTREDSLMWFIQSRPLWVIHIMEHNCHSGSGWLAQSRSPDHYSATTAVITLTHTQPHAQSLFHMVYQAWLWASKLCSEWLTGHWLPDSVPVCVSVCLCLRVRSGVVSPSDKHTFRVPDWSHNPLWGVFSLNKVVRTSTVVLNRCQTAEVWIPRFSAGGHSTLSTSTDCKHTKK